MSMVSFSSLHFTYHPLQRIHQRINTFGSKFFYITRNLFEDFLKYLNSSYSHSITKELYSKHFFDKFDQISYKSTTICTFVFLFCIILICIRIIFKIKPKQINPYKLIYKDQISQGLAKFDNSNERGLINGIYITTNETNLTATENFLKTQPLHQRAIHIGCAGWHNLDLIFMRKSKRGLIIDFNPGNAKFIEITIDMVKNSESREIFTKKMIHYLDSRVGKERALFFHFDQQGSPIQRVERELQRAGSWLSSEEGFLFIRDLFLNECLVAITENMTHTKKFSKIREYLDSNDIVVDTIYLSNICNFIPDSQKQAYIESIKHLLNPHTTVIYCPTINVPSSSDKLILHQKTILGREILDKSFNQLCLFEQ